MILQIQDINLSFTDNRNETLRLLNGLSLDVPKGKITALVGGNGAGKTTLFNLISGFQNGYQGKILFDGKHISRHSPDRIARQGIGRLFQGRQVFGDLSLLDNMKIASGKTDGETPFAYLFRRKTIAGTEEEKEAQALKILNNLFGTGNKYTQMLHAKAGEFSYGEQRILGLARLLMGNYRLLLLDEPTAGVNPAYIETIEQIILKMVREQNLSILLIEHNMRFVREVADVCAYLNAGKIALRGTAGAVLDSREVKDSYLGLDTNG